MDQRPGWRMLRSDAAALLGCTRMMVMGQVNEVQDDVRCYCEVDAISLLECLYLDDLYNAIPAVSASPTVIVQ